jgi:hypothetical protein
MPISDKLIDECKRRIHYRAAWAGIKFLDDDLIVVREDYMATIAVRRQFLGYERGEDGFPILDEHSKPIPMFRNLMWSDVLDSATGTSSPCLRMLTPWLVFIVLGDEIFGMDRDRFSLG